MASKAGKLKRDLKALALEVAAEFNEQDDLVVDIAEDGRHLKVFLSLDGQRHSRFVVVGKTISDWRAMKNVERDVRKELRTLIAIGRG